MLQFSTEVTSSKITSDNPLFQRTLKAYHLVSKNTLNSVLEIGCGEGYGLDIYLNKTTSTTLIDKSGQILKTIKQKYPYCDVIKQKAPPLKKVNDNTFDTVITFQVIEHIKNPKLFLEEIHRVLKPSGKLFLTTPNRKKTIARNPWHYKEYNFEELSNLIKPVFNNFTIQGIEGNSKTDNYYSENSDSVKKILKLDVFNLQHKLPSKLLVIPYEIANRLNRIKLQKKHKNLVSNITLEDYSLQEYSDNTLDFYCVMTK